MKKFFLILALCAVFVIAGCGGSKKENKNEETPDSEETVTDDDTADTDPTDDTEPTEKPDQDTPAWQDDWREEAKECEKLGGYFHGGTGTCRKDFECPEKPELTEWNGSDFFHIEYKDGAWEEKEVASEYNEEKGECHFICDSYLDLVWTGTKCEEFCFLKCNDVENTATYLCDHEKGSETYACRCSIGYEWHADTKTCESACEEGYYWNEAQEACSKDECLDAVCGEHSDGICVRENPSGYHCGCDEGYFWSTSNACWKSNLCSNGVCGEHSNGNCYQVGAEEHLCTCDDGYEWHADTKTCESACEEGYYWHNGSAECVQDGCFNVVCGEHSDGICVRESPSGYHCGCETEYSWNSSAKACWKSDVCHSGVCGEHSTGVCTQTDVENYYCDCETGYSWNSSAKACWKSDVCHSGVCGEHSTGACTQTDAENYYCGCDAHYVWDGTEKKCIPDPCKNPNPCEDMANSDGTCIRQSDTEFECVCNAGSQWNNNKCEECKEIDGNMWSPVYDPRDPNTASSYCNNLSVCGYDDWKLPSVDQLRTLFQHCTKTQTGGACGVSNSCMAESCDNSQCSCASTDTDGYYSKLGDPASLSLWSRSKSSKNITYWIANFGNASLESFTAFDNEFRCVRKTTNDYDPCENQLCQTLSNTTGVCIPNSSNDGYICGCNDNYAWSGAKCSGKQTGEVFCTGLPTNAVWNTVGSITQTWINNAYVPSNIGEYNEEPSTTECRFKCKENYSYDYNTNQCLGATRRGYCTGRPENAQWNTESSIIQTWKGSDKEWQPVTDSVYNTEPSTTKCRFKCNDSHLWNYTTKQCVGSYVGGLYWSESAENLTWAEANEYCQNLDGGGIWRLPTISELRALVQDCPGTVTGGACPITDSNPRYDHWDSNCECKEWGEHNRFGDWNHLWSSTRTYFDYEHNPDHWFWILAFGNAAVLDENYLEKANVRCVR